jgi:hypothetical protein
LTISYNIYYNITLKKYPNIIIKKPTNPKNIRSNLVFITFFKIRNSGNERPTTAIIKARPVHKGIHFAMRDWTIGITLVAFA